MLEFILLLVLYVTGLFGTIYSLGAFVHFYEDKSARFAFGLAMAVFFTFTIGVASIFRDM
jgi:hypothetical protein